MPAWLVPTIVLGASAGLSNFGGAVGLGILPLTPRRRVEIIVTFLTMEVLMPLAGLLLGARLAQGIGNRAEIFAGIVLIAIGGFTLLETRRETKDLKIPVRRSRIVLLAVALSLDNLVVGFGLGLLRAPAVFAATFMGLASLVLTVIGLELGRRLGKRVGERSELLSGLVLIAAGVFVLLHR
jgi:putative Mn2+ efflux pump MntP